MSAFDLSNPVTGYFTKVMGVKSQCRLKDLDQLNFDKIKVSVVPPLPQIMLTTSLPKADNFLSGDNSEYVVTSGTTVLYAGQRLDIFSIQSKTKPSVYNQMQSNYVLIHAQIQKNFPGGGGVDGYLRSEKAYFGNLNL